MYFVKPEAEYVCYLDSVQNATVTHHELTTAGFVADGAGHTMENQLAT